MKKSKRILASLMSVLLVLPSLLLPLSATAEGGDPTPSAYPNADPNEPYYVVGRFQNKGEAATSESVLKENTGNDKDQFPKKSSQGQIILDLGKENGIDVSAFDASKLAVALDVTVSRKDGQTGAGKLNATGNQCLNLWEDKTANNTRVLGLWGPQDHPYLTSFTTNYGDKAGETVRYLIPWAKYVENNATYVSRLQWFVYNDTYKPGGVYNEDAAVDLDIKIENARVVDVSRDGNGYKTGIVAEWQGSDPVVTQNAQGTHTVTIYPWSSPKTNVMTSEMDASMLRLEADVMISGDIDASKIVDGEARMTAKEADGTAEYKISSWSNGKTPKKDTWYHFSWKLSEFNRKVGEETKYLSDPGAIDRFYLFNYNNDGDKAFEAHVKNVRIVDLTVIEPRENLEAAIYGMTDYLFDENAAAVAYDAKVAEGKVLLADRDAAPADMTAKVAEITEAKAALTGVRNTTYDVARFSGQEKALNKADVGKNQFYFNWSKGDGLDAAGANLTDGSENVIGENRYFQAKVTLEKNADYTGTTPIADVNCLKDVQVRLRSSNVGNDERRSDSFKLEIKETDTSLADKVVYTLEVLLNDETEAKGDRKDMDWTDLRDSIIFVNLNQDLRDNDTDKNAPVAIICTLSDVKVVNKTKAVMIAELQQAATEVLENEAQYTADSLSAFKAAQEAAKLVVADSAAAARAIRAEIGKVAAAKTALVKAEVPIDRSALDKAISDADAKLADGKTYTADSLAALNEKLTAARELKTSTDQAAITKAAAELNAAIAGLVEVVPDDMVVIYTDEQTSEITHDMSVSKTLDTPVSLTNPAYEGRELFITFKLRVNKEENFPADITVPDTEWIKKIVNGSVTFADVKLTDKFSCGEGVLAGAKVGEYVDVTVPVTADLIAKGGIDKFRIALFNDLNNLSQEPDANAKGVSISVKDIYLKIGDMKPVARWTAMNERLSLLNEGNAFYFDWKSLDGATDAGINMSGNAENGANPDYVFQATVKFEKLKDIDMKPTDMVKGLMIRLRSGADNKEAAWYTLSADDFAVNEAGDGFTVSFPLSKIDKADMDWTAVRQLLIRQELKDDYHQLVDGQKPAGRVDSEYLAMTLSEVKIMEKAAEPPVVNYDALNKAIEDAKAKLADGKTYTADTLAALNEKLAAAEALKTSTDQAAVTKAADDLNAAITGLLEETTPSADRKALEDAIKAAEAKLTDGKTYTAATLATLNAKLKAARELPQNATQEQVNTAAAELQAAITGLLEETTPPAPDKVALWTEELPSKVQHYMNVYKSIDPVIDLNQYAGQNLSISFKLRVNKDDATFPSGITQPPAEWIKKIVNGTMILWGGADASTKVIMADDVDSKYKLNCGAEGNLLENIVLGEYIEVTMPVPEAIIKTGSLSKFEIFLYNDLNTLTQVDGDKDVGVYITVKDVYLNIGEVQASKSELQELLNSKKSAAELAGYTADSVASYNKLFDDAQDVYDDPDATTAQIASAIASLKDANGVLVPVADNTVMRWSSVEVTKTTLLYGTMFYYDWAAADGVPGSDKEEAGVDLSGTATNGSNEDYAFVAKVTFNPLGETTADQISQMWKALRFRLRSTAGKDAGGNAVEKATVFYELEPTSFDGKNSFEINIPLSMLTAENIDWHNVKELIVQCELNDEYKQPNDGDVNPYFSMTLAEVKVVDNGVDDPDVVKTELNELIDRAEKVNTNVATAGVEEFETALAAANRVAEKADATQTEVDTAVSDLEAALAGLVIPWGDLNGKDGVAADDALLVLQAATKKVELTEDQEYLADVDGNGKVEAQDALLILQLVTKKISSFPAGDFAK